MRLRRQLESAARATYQRLPPKAQQRALALRSRYLGPIEAYLTGKTLLSVVMPVYNVEGYLAEAIDSVLSQSHRNLELILVDDGSTDTSGTMCDEYANRDSRVRVIHKANAGLGAARNTGTAAARGEYLVFIDSDDYLFPGAYEAMIRALHRSGADVATGNVQRRQGQRLYQAWNQSRSHVADRHGVTLEQLPDLLFDTVAWNKVFRRKFFLANVDGFPVNKLYEDMVPMFKALLSASSIEVLAMPVYVWRLRDEGGSITQRLLETRNIDDRFEMLETISALIRERGLQDSLGETLSDKILEGDLWIYVREMAGADDEVIDRITAGVHKFWVPASQRSKLVIPAERRICYWLLEHNRGHEVVAFRQWYDSISSQPPLRRQNGRVTLDVSECPVPLDGIDDLNLDMRSTARGVANVTRVNWESPTTVRVDGYAYTRFVSEGSQQISILLANTGTEGAIEIPVERTATMDSALWARDTVNSHERDGFSAIIDVPKLHEISTFERGMSEWQLSARVTDGEIERTMSLDSIWRGGSAAVVGASLLDDGILAAVKTDPGKPLRIRLYSTGAPASAFSVSGTRFRLEFDQAGVQPNEVWLVAPELGELVRASPLTDGVFTGTVPRRPDSSQVSWQVHARVAKRDERVLAPPGFVSDMTPNRDGMRAVVDRSGRAMIHAYTSTAIVDQIACTDSGELEISGSLYGIDTIELAITPSGGTPGTWLPAEVETGRFHARLSLRQRNLHGAEHPLVSGAYRVHGRLPGSGDDGPVSVLVADATATTLPTTLLRDQFKLKISRAAGGRLGLDLSAPVPDELLGRFAQERLQRRHSGEKRQIEDAAFFYVDLGSRATDSALAIHNELRRRNAGLHLYWGVEDLSIPVPEGGIPVVKNSPEWYDKVNRARYIVNNYGGIHGLTKHPQQRYLQTWHGTPYKYIGASEARHKNSFDSRYKTIEREAEEWDAFVSQSPFMSALIPEDFRYQGRILETGYPRNDRLVLADAAEKQRLRSLLGIPSGAMVLLYAPTFREGQRHGWRASLFEGLDLHRLQELLGPDWYIILRGHSFNARDTRANRSDNRLIDLTQHHDINDLYISSDVLVTDYSSAMFDYAVTGKPMALFTPDIKQFVASRGAYFDLSEEAPGPLYEDVVHLAEGLTDLDSLVSRSADSYAKFSQRFVPWDDGKAAARVVDQFFS